MKIRISWRAQLMLMIESILALLTIVMVWYINSYLFGMLLRYNEDNQMQTLQYIGEKISGECAAMETLSATILTTESVQELSGGEDEMDKAGILLRQEIVGELDRHLNSQPLLHSIEIRTSGGAEVRTESNYTSNLHKTAVALENGQDKWSLASMPVRGQAGNQQAYYLCMSNTYRVAGGTVQIVLSLDGQEMQQIYADFVQSGETEIVLCSQDGVILSSQNEEEIGTVFEVLPAYAQEEAQGSFVFQDQMQVVYLTIPGLGWIVAERMPVAHFRRDINEVRNILIWLLAITMVVLNFLLHFALKRALLPLQDLGYAMRRVQAGKIGYQIRTVYHNEFDEIVATFNSMSQSIPELVEQRQKYALSALRAQINPHFLFNTINTIKWMAVSQHVPQIKSALDKLLILMRPLFKENDEEIPLKEELEYVSNYVSLVNLRFGGNVRMTADVPERLLSRKVPRFILQPVMENCIEHGFRGDYSRAEVTVGCEETASGLILTVQDNGRGIPEEKIAEVMQKLETPDNLLQNGDKLGLANVSQRIRMKYGKSYGLSITRGETGGTVVTLKLPRIV